MYTNSGKGQYTSCYIFYRGGHHFFLGKGTDFSRNKNIVEKGGGSLFPPSPWAVDQRLLNGCFPPFGRGEKREQLRRKTRMGKETD